MNSVETTDDQIAHLQVERLAAAMAQLRNATLASAMRAWKASTAASIAKKNILAHAVSR